jgi:hypothetical protein
VNFSRDTSPAAGYLNCQQKQALANKFGNVYLRDSQACALTGLVGANTGLCYLPEPFAGGGTVALGARETNPEVGSSNLPRRLAKTNEPILLQ